MRDHRGGLLRWGFVGPALLVLIALNVFPLLYNIYLSFTNADLLGDAQVVGAANYARLFDAGDNPEYARALRTTGLFVVSAVGAELVLGFALALALKERFPGKTAILTLLLVPMMLAPAVMGLFWTLILNGNYGILNQALRAIGVEAPGPQWMTDNDLKFVSVVMVDVWMWTPFMMLISLAGLNAIPDYIYEAAEIDRASRWTVFRRITLPMCAPLLLLALLLRATDALKQFDLVKAMTGSTDPSTQTLSALLYEKVINAQKVGLGSAYGCVVLVVVIALATVFIRYIDAVQRKQGRAA